MELTLLEQIAQVELEFLTLKFMPHLLESLSNQSIIKMKERTRRIHMKIGKQILYYRKRKGLTQEQLAGEIGVSFQTVSSWENDEYLPQLEKLEILANALDVTISDICSEVPFDGSKWELNDRMFSEDHMYKFVRTAASVGGLKQTMKALPYARKMHEGQIRTGKARIPYISHPLLMACDALALGLNQDDLIATILLHDVCEDCKNELGKRIDPLDLPVGTQVQEAVRLLTKPEEEIDCWREIYFEGIKNNRLATITKVLDRCNNISTMATGFSKEKMSKYIMTTEQYVLPLLDIMKNDYGDTCYNAAFFIKYQMLSILESLKRLL